ncbi:hypothetical protein ACI0FM_06755 [Paenochrobactrum sp. BZR 588]
MAGAFTFPCRMAKRLDVCADKDYFGVRHYSGLVMALMFIGGSNKRVDIA